MCEDIPIVELTKKYDSPFYAYSKKSIVDKINILKNVFSKLDNYHIAYSLKAESNLSLLKIMIENGIGADVVSANEIRRFINASGDPKEVVFSGVGKRVDEIEYALSVGIKQFNVESIDEAKRIDEIAKRMDKKTKYAIRVNPNVDAFTHKKITTGTKGDKFGVTFDTILNNIDLLKSLTNIELIGLDMHIGSQILSYKPYYDGINILLGFIDILKAKGFNIDTLDIGGGYGINYDGTSNGFDFEGFTEHVIPILKKSNLNILTEPGRFIIGDSGVLVSKIEYIKEEWGKKYIILDASMSDYARVALYDAYNDIKPLVLNDGKKLIYSVAGPVCESSDFFAHDRQIEEVNVGDYVAIDNVGAYGASMASNYNSLLLVEQVLIDGDKDILIRKKQKFEEIIANEL